VVNAVMAAKDNMTEPTELRKMQEDWKNKEHEHHLRSKRIIMNDFANLNPPAHDYFKIEPNSYNLSIQYNREKKNEDEDAKKKDKKAKKEAKNRGSVADDGAKDEPNADKIFQDNN